VTSPQDTVRQFTIGADDEGVRLDRWFKRHLPQVGFATISRWARTGQIRVDGKRVKPEDRVVAGQIVRVPPGGNLPKGPPAPRREISPEEEAEADAMLILRTDSALVLNKPPGLATQGGTGTTKHVDMMLDAYANSDEPRPRLVHRLDKDTSGVLLVARTPGSAAFFSKRFSGRTAKKIYWALVVGVPQVYEGTVEAPIAKQPGSGGEKMHVDEENGQAARTAYRVIDRAGSTAAWVELQPFTGRTHQLRVHMAAIGHPIVGDGKYGGQQAFLTGTISRKMHLHARRLIIDAPANKKGDRDNIDVTAELPDHFADSMKQLGFEVEASSAAPLSEPRPARDRGEMKQAAKAHAKQYRKERRGERKTRSLGGERTGKPAAETRGGKPGADKPRSAKAGMKAVGGKPTGGGRSGGSRPASPRSGPSSSASSSPRSGPSTGSRSGPRSSPSSAPRSGPRKPGGSPR